MDLSSCHTSTRSKGIDRAVDLPLSFQLRTENAALLPSLCTMLPPGLTAATHTSSPLRTHSIVPATGLEPERPTDAPGMGMHTAAASIIRSEPQNKTNKLRPHRDENHNHTNDEREPAPDSNFNLPRCNPSNSWTLHHHPMTPIPTPQAHNRSRLIDRQPTPTSAPANRTMHPLVQNIRLRPIKEPVDGSSLRVSHRSAPPRRNTLGRPTSRPSLWRRPSTSSPARGHGA